MSTNPYLLQTSYTRMTSGFGFGWSKFWNFATTYQYYQSISMKQLINLNSGNKVKVQTRKITGTETTLTAENSCRFIIRKL